MYPSLLSFWIDRKLKTTTPDPFVKRLVQPTAQKLTGIIHTTQTDTGTRTKCMFAHSFLPTVHSSVLPRNTIFCNMLKSLICKQLCKQWQFAAVSCTKVHNNRKQVQIILQETATNVHKFEQLLCNNRSRCHGNVHINDDSKSHRIIPIAWCVTINPIYVRGGHSVRDDKSHIRV